MRLSQTFRWMWCATHILDLSERVARWITAEYVRAYLQYLSAVAVCFGIFMGVGALVPTNAVAVAPTVFPETGSAVSDVLAQTATVYGHVEGPEGSFSCLFEYGFKEGVYSQGSVPCEGGGPGSGEFDYRDVSAELRGLQIGSTYHYRITVSNESGTWYGQDHMFVEDTDSERPGSLPIFGYSATPSTTQAGGHPDIVTRLAFAERFIEEFANECFCQDAETVTNLLPAGLTGNPHAVPQCTRVNFALEKCSPSTQIGVAAVNFTSGLFHEAVYNVEPTPDQAGVIGFIEPLANTPLYIVLSARTGGDYGLDATAAGIPQTIVFNEQDLDLWGVPAEPSHNAERAPIGGGRCSDGPWPCFGPNSSSSELNPFFDNPTSCGEPLSTSLELLAYTDGISSTSSEYPATTGCDQLSFNPSLYAQPTTKQADSASGLDVDLSVPQEESPSQPSPSEIRSLTVKLPQGMSINPNAADGKTSCSGAEARFGTEEEAQCPEFAKVGTATLDSSALPAPITGGIYIGDPQPGERYRLILTANGFDTHVKLLGSVQPDSETGQLVTSFPSLPQAPFTEFNLHFFGSERGLLATPTRCGSYAVESTFTPWDASLSTQTSTQYFKIEEGPNGGACPVMPRPFSPSFSAGVSESTAGAHSPFSLELTRPDGDQDLTALNVKAPPGLSATLKGVPYCSDDDLDGAAQSSYSGLDEEANPSCPIASQIGTAQVGTGAGTHPVYLSGKVYLAGPYKGSPLSLGVITPAVSGPYDLGNVVVRVALKVDPETAQITAVSDPLPLILEGIPLRLRSIRFNLNRPNFVLNPTNCDPFSVDTEAFGEEGAVATANVPFQVANCRSLAFGPKLAVGVTGSTKHDGNPALHSELSYPSGNAYANVAKVALTLPPNELLDNAHIKSPCTRVQFREGTTAGEHCPAGSVIGFARAETPLLEKPLEGQVYLRSDPENASGLPDVVAALNGQIDITLVGKISTVHGGLKTTFATVPDAPVSKFSLSLDGGGKGLLVNSSNLCHAPHRLTLNIVGQNGIMVNDRLLLGTPCRHTAANRRHKKHSRSDRRHEQWRL